MHMGVQGHMEVTLVLQNDLPAGAVRFPHNWFEGTAAELVFGAGAVRVPAMTGGLPGRLELSPDVWEQLAVPLEGLRVQMRQRGPARVELGPAVAVVYAGQAEWLPVGKAAERAALCFGHLVGAPGLFALAFDDSIDWNAGAMTGFLLDNRSDHVGQVVPARFPIPAAVRLSFSIRHRVVRQLRERTGNRAFNWIRGMDKNQFHALASGDATVREHLPETRPVKGPFSLAAMLARHRTVFVKHVLGSRGRSLARVRLTDNGLDVAHLEGGRMVTVPLPDLEGVMTYLRPVLGRGRWIVQQGVNTHGLRGQAAHFRIVLLRDWAGMWRCPTTEALAAADPDLVFTNQANGGEPEVLVEHLMQHHGLSPASARRCEQEMIDLCLRVARLLEGPFHPLGILGFDVAREVLTGKLWIFEANAIPGWGYAPEVEADMAQSLTDFALFLAGWNDRLL